MLRIIKRRSNYFLNMFIINLLKGLAQSAERFSYKEEVTGSNPVAQKFFRNKSNYVPYYTHI